MDIFIRFLFKGGTTLWHIKNILKKEDLVPFDILVYEESVQSEGFSSPEEAFARL